MCTAKINTNNTKTEQKINIYKTLLNFLKYDD